jgi:coproporphyrinogen III oxidase
MENMHTDMGEYYHEVKEVALEGFKRLNATSQVEQKNWDVPLGSWEVSVVRGKVLEKATISHIRLHIKNPFTGEDMSLEVVQAKVYPASPKIPILLFNVENRTTKEDHLAGFLDVVPVAACEEDLRFLAGEIKKVTKRHGEDYEALRRKIEDMYKMDHWEKALNAAIGIRLELAKEQFDLVKEAGVQWIISYFTIVEKREKEPYDRETVALMDSIRTRIVEYYLLGDISIRVALKQGIPLTAMSLGTFAPTLRY